MPRNVPTSAAATWCADHLDGSADGLHRDHDAEHGRDDAEARAASRPSSCSADDGFSASWWWTSRSSSISASRSCGRDAAEDDDLDGVGQEVHRVVVRQELRVPRHDGALRRVLDVRLEGHHARLLRQLEQLVQHAQQFEVVLLARPRLEEAAELGCHPLENRNGRRRDHRPEGGAADDDELGGLDQDGDGPPGHDEAAQDRDRAR